ncbi:hypothetical protein QUY26_27870 [Streptomyces flavofungini]|nr:hypothetical protein [Streptomyces flavofungini]WJV48996.1 hypothetical protein QUY26_27870 [Streptomyces flavofungini]
MSASSAAGSGPGSSRPPGPPSGPSGPFTPLDFQLVLLRRMADHNPDLVADARRALGASIADMREANRRWQAMLHARKQRAAVSLPHGLKGMGGTPIRSVLGPPEATIPRKIGDLDCEALLWPVPLWPDLRFEVLLGPNAAVRNTGAPPLLSELWGSLIRAPGAPGPALRTLADLTPWSCTVDEAAHAFAPARPMEGTAPTRWRLAFTAPDAESGERRRCVAEFTWGLLQRLSFPEE